MSEQRWVTGRCQFLRQFHLSLLQNTRYKPFSLLSSLQDLMNVVIIHQDSIVEWKVQENDTVTIPCIAEGSSEVQLGSTRDKVR